MAVHVENAIQMHKRQLSLYYIHSFLCMLSNRFEHSCHLIQ